MNHSQAVICRNLITRFINELQREIAVCRRRASLCWAIANPETEEGYSSFRMMNEFRDEIREISRDLRALEELSHMLKAIANNENSIAAWRKRLAEVFPAEYTEEDENA